MYVFQVLICNAEGDLIALVPLPFPHQLQDAAWTPLKSNIICILLNSGGQLVILSTTGTILKRVNMRLPQHLSVSSDNVIYVTEEDDGVSQSTDDGKTWSRIIDKPRIGWGYIFAIRLCIKNTTNTWVIEYRHDAQRLRIYSSTSSRDVTLPSNTSFSLHASKLLFDGDSDVYMSDYHNRAVHVWSVHGQYEYKLLFGNYAHSISCLAINKQRSYMYLGIENGFISTFTVQWASRT
jgi:hypothetical protein